MTTSKKTSYKKVIIGTSIGVVFIAVIVWLGMPRQEQATPQNQAGNTGVQSNTALAQEEKSFDFGTVSMAKGKVNHKFKIKNEGADQIVITKLYTSCMCTTALLQTSEGKSGPFGMQGHGFIPSIKEAIKPGEEATVEVVFDPGAHGPAGVGRIERIVYLEREGNSPLEFKITAQVVP